MAEKITYYAIVDDFSSVEHPAGVLRRIKHDDGERDETFGTDLRWARSALLYPLRDLLGFGYWIASYVSNQVQWRGEVYNLQQDGSMRNDSAERDPEAILTA